MLIRTIQTDTLFSSVYDLRSSMGYAAAETAASAIRAVLERKETANVIFAAAPSQNEMLESLLRQDLDFSRINAFHMDEYLGLGLDDSASFSCYLTKHLFGRVTFRTVNLIPAKRTPEAACRAKPSTRTISMAGRPSIFWPRRRTRAAMPTAMRCRHKTDKTGNCTNL